MSVRRWLLRCGWVSRFGRRSRRDAGLVAGAAIFWAASAASATEVQARVEWLGVCGNPEELARETSQRGVELTDGAPAGTLAPEVVRVQVQVTERRGSHPLAAELVLEDPQGGHEQRSLEARSCGELRRGVAWMLVTLAREAAAPSRGPGQGPPADSAWSAPSTSPAFPDLHSGPQPSSRPMMPCPPPPAPHGRSLRDPRQPRGRSTTGDAARLGFALVTGFGFADRPSLGPLLYLDREIESLNLRLKLSAFQLSTLPFRADAATLSIDRLAMRFGAHWSPPALPPLSLGLSAEAGRLIAAGSGLKVSRTDAASWFALEPAVVLRWPLFRKLLWLDLGLSAAYTPFKYQFEYGTGQRVSQAGPFEARFQAGLSVEL